MILTIFLCLAVFYGLAKLIAIPLRIDDFDSFRPIHTEDMQSPGQGFWKSEIDPWAQQSSIVNTGNAMLGCVGGTSETSVFARLAWRFAIAIVICKLIKFKHEQHVRPTSPLQSNVQ